MKTRYLVARSTLMGLLLALASAAYAGTALPETLSVIPQPFWSSLRIFRSEPKVSLILLVPNIAKAQPDYAAINGADLDVFGGLTDDSDKGFTPIIVVPEKRNAEATSVTVEPGNSHKLSSSSSPNLANNWSRIAGVGSTLPAYDTGFGMASGNAAAKLDSAQGQLAGSDLRSSDREAIQPKAALTGRDVQSVPL